MNIGTIVQEPMLKVRFRRGRVLGEVEEYFIQGLVPGDTFIFAGQLLRFEGIREMTAEVTRGSGDAPKIPAYDGGRLPLTTHLADRVRGAAGRAGALADPAAGAVHEWLEIQRRRSLLPDREGLLVESFPRGGKQFLVAYCFEGRNAHQTLGMLLTRRMERMGLRPLGFVATDYVLAVWSLKPARDLDQLFDQDMLGDDLEAWMDESSMLKRTFRNVAVIAGLIERRHPGQEKTGRQVTFNSDLIYDVLRQHEPEPYPAARDPRRCRRRPHRYPPPRRHAGAGQGPHHPPPPRPRLAARRAGAAGDRQGVGLWCGAGRAARRGGEALIAEATAEEIARCRPRSCRCDASRRALRLNGAELLADLSGALVWPAPAPARRRRSASREGLGLRRPRPAAAAL